MIKMMFKLRGYTPQQVQEIKERSKFYFWNAQEREWESDTDNDELADDVVCEDVVLYNVNGKLSFAFFCRRLTE